MIYRAGTGEGQEIEVSGFPLGLSATATYQEESFEVTPGDVILMLTDGLPERLNPKDEYFDYDRTKSLFAEAASGTPEEIYEALLKGGEEWAHCRPQDDDITLCYSRLDEKRAVLWCLPWVGFRGKRYRRRYPHTAPQEDT
jgi:serine phosphatase RsbU (regulator of sigma subunit)